MFDFLPFLFTFPTQKLRELYLISPAGPRKAAWDFLSALAIFYSIIEIPFHIGFQTEPSEVTVVANSIVDAIFFCDIIITLNTGYVDRLTDLLVTNRNLIRKNYLAFWFWIDLVSALPFDKIVTAALTDEVGGNNHVGIVRLVRVLRLVRFLKLVRLVSSKASKDLLHSLHISPAVTSIVALLLQIFLVAHVVCCFWFFITTSDATGINQPLQLPDPLYNIQTWTTTFGFQYSDVATQYIASLYWTFATMLSVGYGDIHATNTGERFFAFLTMLLGSLMFGAIIAKVRLLVESRNIQYRELKICVAEFKSYLEERRIPLALKAEAKVQHYANTILIMIFNTSLAL